MLTAQQARDAYVGKLPVADFIPETLRIQIEENIRMALMMRQPNATIQLDNHDVARNIAEWLQSFGYNVNFRHDGSNVDLLVSWSSILIP